MSNTKSNIAIQHEIVSTINDQVKETVEFFINEGWVDEGWIPSVRIDFLVYRRLSRGGGRRREEFISLETSRYLDPAWDHFTEYKRFEKDPEIGSVFGDRDRSIRTMVIHELCHALQYSKFARALARKLDIKTGLNGHKIFWQTIYRLTRRALVNPKDTPQFNPASKVKEVVKYTSPLPPLKRGEAIKEIQRLSAEGMSRPKILLELMVMRGMKRSTCQVYISQAGPGVGSRPRKAKIKATNLNEFGIVVGK